MSPTTLPTIREVETWDREHRRECQEVRCTLAHRMLAFADWYIVIVRGFEERIATAERKRVLVGLRNKVEAERTLETNAPRHAQARAWNRALSLVLSAIDEAGL